MLTLSSWYIHSPQSTLIIQSLIIHTVLLISVWKQTSGINDSHVVAG